MSGLDKVANPTAGITVAELFVDPIGSTPPAPAAAASVLSAPVDAAAAAEVARADSSLRNAQIISQYFANHPLYIPIQDVQQLLAQTGLNQTELLKAIVPVAKTFARPPISNYQVAAVGLGGSGGIYIGVNLEFLECPLNRAVHAEQCMITNLRNRGETKLLAVALSAAPCGHCRQYMAEIGEQFGDIHILTTKNASNTLAALLPQSFGPQDLDIEGGLLSPSKPLDVRMESIDDMITLHAKLAAKESYAPYSRSPSAVCMQVAGQKYFFVGTYLENAAFNPSLSPLQSALAELAVQKIPYSAIREVCLVEFPKGQRKISQERDTREVLDSVAPHAKLIFVPLQLRS